MAFFCDEKHSLHYLIRGRGEPLLLIHGLGGSGADWAFQVAALEKRFRVIVPDLPGSGTVPRRSMNTPSPDSRRLCGLCSIISEYPHEPLGSPWAAPWRSRWRP